MIGKLGLSGQPWEALDALDFSNMGFIIVGAFVVTWIAAFAIFRLRRVEERWGAMVEEGGLATALHDWRTRGSG